MLEVHPETSEYRIELPAQLWVQHLHTWFHQSKLCPHITNDDALFPHWEEHAYYDYGTPDDQEWLVDSILAHQWDKGKLLFQIHWNLGDTTWEPLETCKDLQALDEYLSLLGVKYPQELPWRGILHGKTTKNPLPKEITWVIMCSLIVIAHNYKKQTSDDNSS